MSILTSRERGKRVLAMGNEAIARGALEAGIGFMSTYPGTPASEVGDSIAEVQQELKGLHFEYSINEIVALEGAVGAVWAGVRSLVAMKHVGMNIAADALHGIGYIGTKGLVIVNGGDPGITSSSNEQDNRWYSLHTHFPILAPSNIQEAKDFTIKAFELSEAFGLPFIVDAPWQLCHALGCLELGDLPPTFPSEGSFEDPMPRLGATWLPAVERHRLLLDKERRVREYAATSELNRVLPGTAKWGIITSGVDFGFTTEALDMLGLYDVPILKLGLVYPLSPQLVADFLKRLEKVVIVEELEGFLESEIKKVCYDRGLRVSVLGKEIFPAVGALSASTVAVELGKYLGIPLPQEFQEGLARLVSPPMVVPTRMATFCPGCSHRGSAYALKEATGGVGIYGGDIGCYALVRGAPFNLTHWGPCMGAGVGIAQGMSHKVKDRVITAFIGDSTFFHAGLQPVMNAVYQDANVLLIVLDNSWVAMTGHQPTPGTPVDLDGNPMERSLSIVEILRGIGVKYLRMVDPYQPKEMIQAIQDALEQPGFKVLVAQQECARQSERRERRHPSPVKLYHQIEPERCQKCDICFLQFGCPAIATRTEGAETIYYIDEGRCNGCGACKTLCPNSAILTAEVNVHLAEARV